MSAARWLGRALWGAVSSGFRGIEIGWNPWGLLPHLLPQLSRLKSTAVIVGLTVITIG